MNVFQYLAAAVVTFLAFTTLRSVVRGTMRKRVGILWLSLWTGAGVAAVWPDTTVIVARKLGIGRGADLVLYVSVFASLIVFFLVYARLRKLDRALTLLVRQIAIESPRLPGDAERSTTSTSAPKA